MCFHKFYSLFNCKYWN